MKRLILTVLVSAVVLFGACAAPSAPPAPAGTPAPAPSSPPAPSPAATVIEVTAQELYSAYEANQVAADAKYKDKIVRVTGIVNTIGKDILDTPYVLLTSGGQYEMFGVQCMFDKKYELELAQLIKGQTVTVEGRVSGYLVNVLIKDTVLIGSLAVPTPAPSPAATVIEVTAQELYSAYEANQVAADAKYKDKIVRVTGIVNTIGKDILDTPYVLLTSGGQYEMFGVQCMFDKKYELELAQLIKGQTVTVQGKVSSYLANVIVADSVLVR